MSINEYCHIRKAYQSTMVVANELKGYYFALVSGIAGFGDVPVDVEIGGQALLTLSQ